MSAVMVGQRDQRPAPSVQATGDRARRAELYERAAQVVPVPGEGASSFAARLHARLAYLPAPDFAARLAARAAEAVQSGHRLRVLSLGSGRAVAECTLSHACEAPLHLVLTGDDEEALSAALAPFHPRHHLSYRIVDLEEGLARWNERFDVVFTHATLFRIIRLEPLLHDIRRVLVPDGELWISREQVGPTARHGTRLLHWLHKYFVPVDECSGLVSVSSADAVDLDLARLDHVARLRAAAVEGVLLPETSNGSTFVDGIYAVSPAR